MKPPIENPSDRIMRFFTPELYIQFNSQDEEIADRANNAWEDALQEYQKHLDGIRNSMPSQVRKVAELDLHDAEFLGLDEELQSCLPLPESSLPPHFWSAMAVLTLKQDRMVRSLIYLLWDGVRKHPPKHDWPFSMARKHLLYDEVDVAAIYPGTFFHRILFSDGGVVEIPFVSVVASSVIVPDLPESETTRRIA